MVLVFDVGATHIRLALANHGELGDVVRVDTDQAASGFSRFLGLLQELSAGQHLSAVAGGMPGELEGDDGHLALAPNLPDWIGLPVEARIKQLFDCPVYVLNDVELGGLGEAHAGAGSSRGIMAYFTVSTGVNAVRIVDGKIDPSIRQFELGKLLIESKGGHPISLEALTGGASLAKRERQMPAMIHDPAVWKSEVKSLARGVYDVMLAWTPETIVFGGGMARDVDLAGLQRELEALPPSGATIPRLVKSKLGDLGGLRGALVWLGQTK